MPRQPRIHSPNGLYYVVLRGYGGRPIFLADDYYDAFSTLLATSLKRSRSRVHAYCWLRNRAHLAVQVSDVPVCRLVQYLTSQYARWVRKKLGRSGQIFAPRYRALLVDHTRYLAELVRYIHRSPLRAGLAGRLDNYAWSSHAVYLGEATVPWLTTHATLALLDRHGIAPAERYSAFVLADDDDDAARRFERGHAADSRVVGDDAFLASLRNVPEDRDADDSLVRLIEAISSSQGVSARAVVSPSRRRRLVMTRALITWRATQSGLATLTEVADYLRRSPSTLWAAVERYRAQRPELFTPPDDDAAPGED